MAGSLGLVGITVLSIQPVFADDVAVADDSGWYIGGNIGRSTGNIDDDSINDYLMSTGATSVSFDDDDSDTAYKLFGGYRYNKNFAVEGGYFNLGQLGYTATTIPAGILNGEVSIRGLNLDLLGIYPFTEKFSAFGRVGLNYAKTEATFSSSGLVATPANTDPSKNAANYKFGVGLEYDFTERLSSRTEIERYRINDALGDKGSIDMLSFGLVYRFGGKKSQVVPHRKAPPEIVAVAVKTEEYCSLLDIEFDIKQKEVQIESLEKLAALGTFMKKYPNTTAVIEGHSDNVGESDYNLQLSNQRAENVVDYLVNKQDINASRLSAKGYGETRPRAYNTSKEGQQSNRRINAVIECVDDIAGLEVAPTRITMVMALEFEPSKHQIKSKYLAGLKNIAVYLKANPGVTAMVEGYADRYVGIGADETQMDTNTSKNISKDRAQTVVSYLVNELGIDASRLNINSYGQTSRTTYGTTLDAQQENRRVNIIFMYPKK